MPTIHMHMQMPRRQCRRIHIKLIRGFMLEEGTTGWTRDGDKGNFNCKAFECLSEYIVWIVQINFLNA